jgi:uncharacterized protein
MLAFLAESCCSPNLIPASPSLDPWLLLGTGLTISLGHCVGMCGPLVSAYGLAQGAEEGQARKLLPGFLLYHGGRLFSYALIGGAFGLIGSATRLAGQGQSIQGGLSLAVGLFMAILGLGLAGWLPTTRRLESARLSAFVGDRLRGLLGKRGPLARLSMGMGNGLLPCGPVYAVAIGGMAAGSAWRGALAMLLFGAGTVPVLLALGLGAGRLSPRLQGRFNKVAALLVVVIGLQLLLRGLAAFGWIGHLRWGEFVLF